MFLFDWSGLVLGYWGGGGGERGVFWRFCLFAVVFVA